MEFKSAHLMQQKIDIKFIEEKIIKRFCKDVKELAIEIRNYRKQDMIPLTDEEVNFYEGQNVCHICKKEFCYDDENNKNKFRLYKKVRHHCHYTGKFRGADIRYKVPK